MASAQADPVTLKDGGVKASGERKGAKERRSKDYATAAPTSPEQPVEVVRVVDRAMSPGGGRRPRASTLQSTDLPDTLPKSKGPGKRLSKEGVADATPGALKRGRGEGLKGSQDDFAVPPSSSPTSIRVSKGAPSSSNSSPTPSSAEPHRTIKPKSTTSQHPHTALVTHSAPPAATSNSSSPSGSAAVTPPMAHHSKDKDGGVKEKDKDVASSSSSHHYHHHHHHHHKEKEKDRATTALSEPAFSSVPTSPNNKTPNRAASASASTSPKKKTVAISRETSPRGPQQATPSSGGSRAASDTANIFGDDDTSYDPKSAIDLWPTRIPRFDWQVPLANKIANNSKTLLTAAIQIALVESTAISSNRLYLRAGDQNDLNRGVTMLFTEMQDEKTQQVLRHHAAYKSFWYKSGTMKSAAAGLRDFELAAHSDRALVQTLVSYVPRIVVRRFVNEPHKPLRAPETETYYACVLFADISGFTPLTSSMATLGAEGVEKVTTHLNTYFSNMINLINDHGGDVVKFAGDALIVIWPTSQQSSLYSMALLGCQCALALQRKMGHYVVGETELRIHIGVGAGKVAGIHVGGVQGRHEFFVAGHPMEQVGSCEEQAEPGEIFVSPECQSIIDAHFVGELIGHNFRLDNIESPMSLPHTKEFPLLDVLKTRLRSYVPAAVLSNLDTHDYLAELRTISVLFVKLDYTYVNEDESPMAIQIYVAGMQAVIARYEGTVRQFIVDDKGSVLIAAFGLPPLAHEDDPTRAVECALEIDKVLKSLNMSGAIGITTGNVFCGAVGSEARREYAMVGDVVNMSARLMVAAVNKGGILCDRSTYIATKSSLKYAVLDPIKVKGKEHPIDIFRPEKGTTPASLNGPQRQLTFRDSPAVPPAAAGGGPSPGALIGQAKVVNLFGYKLDQLTQHNQTPGHVLILEGEAGIGKSKLVERLAEMANKNADIFLGTLDFGGTQQLFGPWALVFDTLLDLQNGEVTSEEQLHAQVIEDINNISNSYAAPPELFPSWESIAPLLNIILPLLGLPETDVTRSMNEQTRTETLQLLLLRLLQTYVLPGAIIVLEDAHEFDSASWTLALAASQQLKGVLIVICMRPPRPPVPFEYQQILHCEHATHVSLKPLTSSESIQLAESILELKNTRLPTALANVIGEKGQGNPFIIEQMIGALKSSGAITVDGDSVKIKDNAMLAVPTTVYGLITSKIDRLSPLEKNILKIASVIGKLFDYTLVKHLLPSCSKQELLDSLSNLVKAGLILREENATALDTMESEESAELRKSRRNRVGSLSSSLSRRVSIGPPRRSTDAGVSDDTTGNNSSPAIDRIKKSQESRSGASSSPTVKHAKRSPPVRSPDSPRSEDENDASPPRRRKGQKIEKADPAPKLPLAAVTASSTTVSSSNSGNTNGKTTSPRDLKSSGAAMTSPASGSPNSPRGKKEPTSADTPSSSSAPSPVTEKLRPSSPRPTRPTSPRRFDSSETPRRTLRRGLSMRGTSRSLTLRKMSLTSDGGTPRASAVDSISDEGAQEASEWSFRNQTIHECVYTMMLFAQRRHIHGEIAKWYEVTYHEALSHHAAILGYHLKMAEENAGEAAKWFAVAGQKALRNFSNQEAVSYFLESIQLQKRSSKHVVKTKDQAVSPRSSPVKITLAAPASPRTLDEGAELSLLTTHRKLGQAYFNLGDFNNARLHLRLSLKVVKLDLTPGPWKSATTAPIITKLKEFQTVLSADAYTQREVILALLTMAKVCYFSCSLDLAVYCNLASLALAKHSNFWSELSEAYAQCIVTAGLCDQHQLASQYIQEGTKLAQDHLALMSTMNVNSGLYYLSRCAWQLSKRFFKSSMETSQAMGDRRRFEDVLIYNGQIRLIRGKFKQAVAKVTLALNSARLRGDVQCQILALIVQIVAHLSLRNFMKATSKLDQVRIMLSRDHMTVSSAAVYVGAVASSSTPTSARRQSLTGANPLVVLTPHEASSSSLSPEPSARSGDLSSEFNYHTLMASLCLARGDTVAAHESIQLAEEIMLDKHIQPAGFWMFPGYMGVPEIYLRLLMHPREWKKIHMTRNKLIKRFNRSIDHLRTFSRVFLFAAPRYHLLMGLGMLASGTANLDKVLIEWKRGQDLAKQYKMTGEEQLIQSHMEAEVTPTASTSTSESLLVPRSESNDQSTEKPKKRRRKAKRGSTNRSSSSPHNISEDTAEQELSPRTADPDAPEVSDGHSAASNAYTPNFGASPLLDSESTSAEPSS